MTRKPPKDRRPTQYDVARLAGVSQAAVSRVLNNSTTISLPVETRQRILRAMDVVGYQPNVLARSLRMGETHMLGLIFPDSANPFFAAIGRSIEELAFNQGYSVILCNTEGNPERERFYADLLSRKQVDGIIFVAGGNQADCLGLLQARGVPVVVVDRDLRNCEADVILLDNYAGGYLAGRHLLDMGHTQIGCITGPSNVNPSAERVAGFRKSLLEAGLSLDDRWIRQGDFHMESGWRVAEALLDQAEPPTAIFACNDLMAVGVLRAIAEQGWRVPEDVSVVGFDDIELASYTAPPLTTIAQPSREISARAVEMMVNRIQNPDTAPLRELFGAALVVRGSSGSQKGGGIALNKEPEGNIESANLR